MFAPLSADPTRLPHVIDTHDTLSAHTTASPPINLVHGIHLTLISGDEQWEPALVHRTRVKARECLGCAPRPTL